MFAEYSDKISDNFSTLKISCECLSPELKTYLLKQGKEGAAILSEKSWPSLYARDYMEFCATGNRTNFEDKFFSRRNLLMTQVLAECLQKDGEYLQNIVDGIMLLCEESAWNLPAHNSYVRDTPQENIYDTSRPIVELFACETSALLSVIYSLLKDQLDQINPFIRQRIFNEIKRRIVDPYLSSHFWWMGNGDEPMCNWTPWCTQNILMSVFLLPFENEIRVKVIKQALKSLDCFLKDYGDDGCCNEGAEYYRHAGLCLFNAADILDKVTGGIFEPVFNETKIKNIAEYIMNMNIPHTNYFFNFADCSTMAGKSGAREFLFGKRTASNELCCFASEQWNLSSEKEKLLGLSYDSLKGNNLYYILQSLKYDKEITEYKNNHSYSGKENVWYKSVGVFIVNNQKFSCAVKAGCNGDSHNHNDTGSFIIYKNGKPFAIDLGVESYTKKTFSPQRYEIWTMQSSFHNLMEFDGIMQKDGKEFCADKILVNENEISMELKNAYPAEAKIKSYNRKVQINQDSVCINDICDSEKKSVLNLMFCQKPEIVDGKTIKIASTGTVEFNKDVEFKIEEHEVSDARLRLAWPEKIYRVRIEILGDIQFKYL